MSSTVFIITDELDDHVDAVILELHKRNVPVFRFHPDEYPRRYRISIEVNNGSIRGEVADEYRTVEFADIGSVWFRGSRTLLPSIVTTDARLEDYIRIQAQETIKTMNEALSDNPWVSDPRRVRRADVKAVQLVEAARAGLKTPRTLISNDVKTVTSFKDSLGITECAVKPLALEGVQSEDGYRFPLTTLLPDGHPLDSAAYAPTIFQPYIDKVADLRCVVMEDKIFCAKILSQEQEESKRDWRGADCKHEPFSLPLSVQSSIHKMMSRFDLNLASLDMLLTRDEDFVFLELNPLGQWLWLEYEAGFPLVTTMTDLLTKHQS